METTPSGLQVWLALKKATHLLEIHAIRSIEATGLCHSDFAILDALLREGSTPVNTLGKAILLTSGSITIAIDRLEKRQLVARKPSEEDRRICLVHLTDSGRQLIEPASALHAAAMEEAIQRLTLTDKSNLLKSAKKLDLEPNISSKPNPRIEKPSRKQPVKQPSFSPEPPSTETGFEGFTGLD